jgi:hypothetical protein
VGALEISAVDVEVAAAEDLGGGLEGVVLEGCGEEEGLEDGTGQGLELGGFEGLYGGEELAGVGVEDDGCGRGSAEGGLEGRLDLGG